MIAVLCANISIGQPAAGTEAARSAERCVKRIRLAAENFGGSLVSQGDGNLTLVFQRFSDAVLAAGIFGQRIADLPSSGGRPTVHIGICSGEVLDEPDAAKSRLEYIAAKLAEMAQPMQVLFCMAEGKLGELSPDAVCSVHPLHDSSLDVGDKKYGICEFRWQESRGLTPRRLAENVIVPRRHFRVRHRSREFTLDDKHPSITIGRSPDCQIILTSRKVSRQHVRIERRGNQLVVIDQSVNGTYIYQSGQGEVLLHKDERVISGRGELCIGAPASTADVDRLSFEA